jgi:hypothetical protein
VAVGSKTRSLLVAREHMAQTTMPIKPAIQREVVHSRDTEHGVDTVRGEQFYEVASDRSCC